MLSERYDGCLIADRSKHPQVSFANLGHPAAIREGFSDD